MIAKLHVIILNNATPAVINQAHELIKSKARGWWHRFSATWIVGGDVPTNEWRDLLKPVIAGTAASVLVLRLPDEDQNRNWSYSGRKAKEWCEWLHKNVRN